MCSENVIFGWSLVGSLVCCFPLGIMICNCPVLSKVPSVGWYWLVGSHSSLLSVGSNKVGLSVGINFLYPGFIQWNTHVGVVHDMYVSRLRLRAAVGVIQGPSRIDSAI